MNITAKKESKYVLDMTRGSEVPLLLKFAAPMLIGNIFQQFYNMADSIIVGKYVGTDALGAVGSVGSLNFFFFSLCMGLGSGLGILISQYFGAGEHENVKSAIANSIYITLSAGFLVSILGFALSKPILIAMHTPAENFGYALTYMRIVCGATFIVAVYNAVSSILRALGDSKTPLLFLVLACFINIGLDLLFVIVFKMEVAGAALATVIAQFISAAGSVIFGIKRNPYFKLETEHFKANKDIISKGIRLGLPIAAQGALIAFSCVSLQSVINHFGSVVMAAFTATSRVEQLVQQPFSSLGTALSTFAGQNAGAGRHDRVVRGCKKSIQVVLIFSAAMVAVMYLFGYNIVSLFVDEPEVIEIGAKGLQITSWMYAFLGLIYILRGMLNGVGDAAFAMINGVVEVIGRVGFACLLMLIPSIGLWSVWYTNGLTWTITGIANVIRVLQGKWKNKSVIKAVHS